MRLERGAHFFASFPFFLYTLHASRLPAAATAAASTPRLRSPVSPARHRAPSRFRAHARLLDRSLASAPSRLLASAPARAFSLPPARARLLALPPGPPVVVLETPAVELTTPRGVGRGVWHRRATRPPWGGLPSTRSSHCCWPCSQWSSSTGEIGSASGEGAMSLVACLVN